MAKVVKVKDIKIGEGIPKIAVPLVGTDDLELVEEAKQLKTIKFDVVEWRVDYYKNVEDVNAVKNILKKLRLILPDTPILFTFRTKKEGGEKDITVEYYIKLNCEICKTKQIDLVDVELFTGNNFVSEIVEIAHTNGVRVIMSNHDFFKTPPKEEKVSRLIKMME